MTATAEETAREIEECAKFIRDEEMPKYTEIAKQVNGNLYRIEEALAAAYRHGLRYKHEMEIQRRVDNALLAHGAAERARAIEECAKYVRRGLFPPMGTESAYVIGTITAHHIADCMSSALASAATGRDV